MAQRLEWMFCFFGILLLFWWNGGENLSEETSNQHHKNSHATSQFYVHSMTRIGVGPDSNRNELHLSLSLVSLVFTRSDETPSSFDLEKKKKRRLLGLQSSLLQTRSMIMSWSKLQPCGIVRQKLPNASSLGCLWSGITTAVGNTVENLTSTFWGSRNWSTTTGTTSCQRHAGS